MICVLTLCASLSLAGASLVAQMVKRLPAVQDTQVRSLGWEDPLEEEMATHSSILGWKFHRQRRLAGYSPWDCKESDMTEQLTHISLTGKGHLESFTSLACSCYCSVAQSCPTLCDPIDCSTPGLPVHHQLPELAQMNVHQVGDAIQPSHLLSSLSPPAFNLAQHQGLFQ